MAQTSGFDPTTQVKTCFDCKMFDVTNWVACLNGENGPGGMPSHEALSVSPQGALEIASVPPCLPAVLQLRGKVLKFQRESRTRGQRLPRDDNLRLRPTINVYFS